MVVIADCSGRQDYNVTVPAIFDRLDIDWKSWEGEKIALKPNLVCHNSHPLTTDPILVGMVGEEIRKRVGDCDVFIIEGAPFDTTAMYVRHGYVNLPYRLIDIDTCGCYYDSTVKDETLPSLQLPVALKDAKLVSVAVLKEHQDCTITACVKNLVGIVPSGRWSDNGLNKTKLHDLGIDKVIKALLKHRPIDLAVLDATIGTRGDNTDGKPCVPPIGKMLVGDDAVEVDRIGAKLLGHDPAEVTHLN